MGTGSCCRRGVGCGRMAVFGGLRQIKSTLQLLSTAVIVGHVVSAWYLPGSAPQEYEAGAPVEIKVNKMTSAVTQLPYSYYHVGFCAPIKIEDQTENLGEILKGDIIQNTIFDVKMKVREDCKLLCNKKVSHIENRQFVQTIDEEYLVHMMADNLPVAMMFSNPSAEGPQKFYSTGFPVGYIMGTANKKHVLLNHLNFHVKYHTREEGTLRVVGFEVEPKSIMHEAADKLDCKKDGPLVVLEKLGTSDVFFTYSVTFEESPIRWATRWDSYLSANSADTEIHWFSIVNSLMIVLLLSGIMAMILLRTLLRDIAQYNELDDLEEAHEESGWKLCHGDVFRKPQHSKMLAVCSGTGMQICGMLIVTLVLATMGLLSPANRGALLQAGLILFTFMGLPAGYISARFNKLFQGDQTNRSFLVTLMTAFLFPAACFGIFFVLNIVLWTQQSSGAVRFSTMFLMLVLWFGISVPLVFFGSYLGYRKQTISVPVRTNQIPRQIPPQHWVMNPIVSHTLTGILPFGAIFTELLFIMSSVWQHEFYYLFGFLFLVFLILLVTSAEIAIAFTYFLLCAEDYRWWWRSYLSTAASAVYVYLYAAFYFATRLHMTRAASIVLYFGYMFIISYAFFLLTGAVGFLSSFFFVRAIYTAVKVD